MAGLSITRRRKAWLKGVVYGALGKGKCALRVPVLQQIFQRGLVYGQTHARTPYVKALVEQAQRRRQRSAGPRRERPARRPGLNRPKNRE